MCSGPSLRTRKRTVSPSSKRSLATLPACSSGGWGFGVGVGVGVGVDSSCPPSAVGVALGVAVRCADVFAESSVVVASETPTVRTMIATTAMTAAMPRKLRRWFRLIIARLETPHPTERRTDGSPHRQRSLGGLARGGPRPDVARLRRLRGQLLVQVALRGGRQRHEPRGAAGGGARRLLLDGAVARARPGRQRARIDPDAGQGVVAQRRRQPDYHE